jgi:hypothetical protein
MKEICYFSRFCKYKRIKHFSTTVIKPEIWKPYNKSEASQELLQKWGEKLASSNLKGDPLADQTVEMLMKSNNQRWYMNFMRLQMLNFEDLPKEYPEPLREYVHEVKIPEWADNKRLSNGLDVYSKFSLPISSVLSWTSLPFLYTFPEGVEVLARTGEITHNCSQRITNTCRMIGSIGEPNAFTEKGRAITTISKVRLTHAFVRYSLKNGVDWDLNKFSLPINQRDMAVTLMSFSALIIDSLEKLGADFEEYEYDGYIHLWNVVGCILGIDEELLPSSIEEGYVILRLSSRDMAYSENGEKATKALINFLHEKTPGKAGDHVHETMMNYLLGPEVYKILGIENKQSLLRFGVPFFRFMLRAYDKTGDKSKTFSNTMGRFSKKYLLYTEKIMRKGRIAEFELGQKLQNDLRM